MKDKFKKAINCILSKDDAGARELIKEAISQHPKYIEYKSLLKEMGLDFKFCDIDEKTYTIIQETLEKYPVPVRLKILDEVYKQTAQ